MVMMKMFVIICSEKQTKQNKTKQKSQQQEGHNDKSDNFDQNSCSLWQILSFSERQNDPNFVFYSDELNEEKQIKQNSAKLRNVRHVANLSPGMPVFRYFWPNPFSADLFPVFPPTVPYVESVC